MSNFKKERRDKRMTKKPNHLTIHTHSHSQFKSQISPNPDDNEGDYNEELEEKVAPEKNEQITQMGKLEPKNLNYLNNEGFVSQIPSQNDEVKFYTNPDDFYAYHCGYPYYNFSFTPQNQSMFPAIPMRYNRHLEEASCNMEGAMNYYSGNANRSSNSTEKESNLIQTANDPNHIATAKNEKINVNTHSTRNSTESNESVTDANINSVNSRKYYTPTHQNSNMSRPYDFSQVQRELDFNNMPICVPNNIALNKFNNYSGPRPVITSSANTAGSLFSPTNNTNNFKSNSFCANNNNNNNINSLGIKPQNGVKYNPVARVNTFPGNATGVVENKLIATMKNEENLDYKINLENIIIGKDKRTTLMLRNIPNKYSLQNLVDEINPSFWGKYDYINLPIDYERKLNLGYAFVNFNDPMHIVMFFETYYNKKWSKYRSDKKIDLNYAEKQGKKETTCKDENTYFAAEDKKKDFKKTIPKLEIPMKYFDFFKKIHPTSVCIVENKNGVVGEKTFTVKTIGKK